MGCFFPRGLGLNKRPNKGTERPFRGGLLVVAQAAKQHENKVCPPDANILHMCLFDAQFGNLIHFFAVIMPQWQFLINFVEPPND